MSSRLTLHCLNSVLGTDNIESFDIQAIGEGMMSDCYRITLNYRDTVKGQPQPNTLIYKTSAADETSRSCGIKYGLYEQEVRFHTDLSSYFPQVVPKCYDARFDFANQQFSILMSDAAPAISGDDIVGATLPQAQLAMQALGRIHGFSLTNRHWTSNFEWLEGQQQTLDGSLMSTFFQMFTTSYGPYMDVDDLSLCKLLVDNYDHWIHDHVGSCVRGLLHGDFRLDNMLFGGGAPDSLPITVVDWQNVKWAPILGDVAYFLGGCLGAANQQSWLQELLQIYVDNVGKPEELDIHRCFKELKIAAFYGITVNIASAVLLKRTERGSRLLPILMKRHCQFIRQLGSDEIFREVAV